MPTFYWRLQPQPDFQSETKPVGFSRQWFSRQWFRVCGSLLEAVHAYVDDYVHGNVREASVQARSILSMPLSPFAAAG